MKSSLKFLFIMALMAIPLVSAGQQSKRSLSPEKEEVLQVILDLFEAYRQGDADAAALTFDDNAQMQRVQNKDGVVVVSVMVVVVVVSGTSGGRCTTVQSAPRSAT